MAFPLARQALVGICRKTTRASSSLKCRGTLASGILQLNPSRIRALQHSPSPWTNSPQRLGKRGIATTVSASELQFGQPVHETHPHLLKAGELTPGISAQEYYDRRQNLAALLPENGIAILVSAELRYRSGAVFFPFRQDSNFLYLTGFAEQDAVAVIRKTGQHDHEFRLYVRPKDATAEQWSGPWSGVEAAMDVWNADVAGPISAAAHEVGKLAKAASPAIYTDAPAYGGGTGAVKPLAPLVNSLRAIKSPAEVANMRHAGRVSGRAFTAAMRGDASGSDWKYERDLALFLDHTFATTGCDGQAYVPVVAGGSRGSMIHYVHNNRDLPPGEMVLVDAGGEYGTYITDITRTWPINDKFTPAQRDLYEAVLKVQRSAVSLCRADSGFSLDKIHMIAQDGLRDQLIQLGFEFDGRNGRTIQTLFPHHLSHYVGLDVHDTPGYSRSVPLQQGHCVTVEPGIYVPDDERWPEPFRGMAIRIEDSICVLDDVPLVLTSEAVKEVADVEALRA
ncbi:hypothetical protein MCOR25_008903 [Pyricularia grisea]|nr:hypothetical protein MCOR25_008903 [Pyricularia grisea]